jgi:hypothetical protein
VALRTFSRLTSSGRIRNGASAWTYPPSRRREGRLLGDRAVAGADRDDPPPGPLGVRRRPGPGASARAAP